MQNSLDRRVENLIRRYVKRIVHGHYVESVIEVNHSANIKVRCVCMNCHAIRELYLHNLIHSEKHCKNKPVHCPKCKPIGYSDHLLYKRWLRIRSDTDFRSFPEFACWFYKELDGRIARKYRVLKIDKTKSFNKDNLQLVQKPERCEAPQD